MKLAKVAAMVSYVICMYIFLFFHQAHFLPNQVWSVKYNKEGNQVVSVSDDKSLNIYSIPV